MKQEIHPEYVDCTVICGCGETFRTRSTKPKIMVEICSKCHPFYTGRQKLVDTTGKVERFRRRYRKGAGAVEAVAKAGLPLADLPKTGQ
ncbi:MAG TPA: 50S ribosomal protein L31 [Candidatus Hypogeohydataceae bacterium YC41]